MVTRSVFGCLSRMVAKERFAPESCSIFYSVEGTTFDFASIVAGLACAALPINLFELPYLAITCSLPCIHVTYE